jgi:hypothetical protein
VWAWDDYEKLRPYDAPTGAQPTAGFSCHATPEHYCHGWAVVHSSRGHEYELLALRINWPADGTPESDVDTLFASGGQAADHGQAEVDSPSAAAIEVGARLVRKYRRLRSAGPLTGPPAAPRHSLRSCPETVHAEGRPCLSRPAAVPNGSRHGRSPSEVVDVDVRLA